MAKRVILGGLVGGVLTFVLGAVIHMATPLGKAGLSVYAPEKEQAVLDALKAATPKAGMYFIPGMDMSRPASESEEKAWEARIKAGPSGLLVLHPEGTEPMSPKQLVTQ